MIVLHISFVKKTCFKTNHGKNKEEAFLSGGFHSWNKATTAFRVHQKSKCPLAGLSFDVAIPCCSNVIEMSNESMKASIKEKKVSHQDFRNATIRRPTRIGIERRQKR